MKKILLFAAAGVAIAVSFTLIGMSVGISAASSDYAKLPPKCTVKDQNIAEFHRSRQIDEEVENKIDMKVRILSEVGRLKAKKKSLAFEIDKLDHERLQLSVDIERQKRALTALKAEEL